MSLMGHSRRFGRVQLTSGLTPQADIIADHRHVSKVPIASRPQGPLLFEPIEPMPTMTLCERDLVEIAS